MPPFANPLQPVWKAQPSRWDYAMAAHLLNRAGFGGRTADVELLFSMGPQKAVDYLIDFASIPQNMPGIEFGELSGPLIQRGGGKGMDPKAAKDMRERGEMVRELSAEQKRALLNLRQAAQRVKLDEMKLWWLDRMVRSQRPLEEKMTLFWHGLFVSSYVTVKESNLLYNQNVLFRKYATGNFKALTLEVAKDPAMLEYLNNNQNKKAKPNENFARELMELFTMGIGNYTEADIKESARAFTGWTYVGDRFIYNRNEHDDGIKNFLGRRGNFDGADIIDIIFDQPATPRYLATRLLTFFAVDDEMPLEVVTALASVIKSNKFELAPTLQLLFASNWFYSENVMRRQIKSPVQLVVGSLRSLGVNIAQPKAVDDTLKMMGQELFVAPTVKGWDGGRAWINTSTLFARYNMPAYLGTGRLPAVGKKPEAANVRSQFEEFSSGWNPQIDLAEARVSTTDGVVDLYIRKLIGSTIAENKRTELIEFLNATGDSKSHLFDPISAESENRLRSLVHLIMSMADYQIC